MKTIFETDRLIAREFILEDDGNILKLLSDKKVVEYTDDKVLKDIKEAQHIISTHILPQYKDHGFGKWAIHLKANGLFLGWCGINKTKSEEIILEFSFHKRFWNKGFASEIAKKTIDYCKDELKIKEITAKTHTKNIYAMRVLEKIGMIFLEDTNFNEKKYYIKTKI